MMPVDLDTNGMLSVLIRHLDEEILMSTHNTCYDKTSKP